MLSSIPHELTDPSIPTTPLDLDTFGDQMSLPPAESTYRGIQSTSTSSIMLAIVDGTTPLPITTLPLDPCKQLPSTDKVVRETMSFGEQHLEDWHIWGLLAR